MADPLIRIYHRTIETRPGLLVFSFVLPITLFVVTLYFRVVQIGQLFSTPPATTGEQARWVLQIVYQALAFLFYVMLVGFYMFRKPLLQPVTSLGGMLAALAGSFAPFGLVFVGAPGGGPALLLVSVILMTGGMLFSLVGLAALRRNFGILPEVRGLVRHGLYRYVRHPVYTGEIVTTAGIALPLQSLWALVVFAIFVLLQYVRTRYEEAALTRHFPEYALYRKNTGRFFPGIP